MVSIEYRELAQLDVVVARKWLGRFFTEGEAGLKDYPRRPHHMPRKTPDEVEELVVGIRKPPIMAHGGLRRHFTENRALSFLTVPCKKF